MITRRDFIKGLGAMAAVVVMPRVEEPEELHVTFTEAEDVFRYTWNPETGEETLVTGESQRVGYGRIYCEDLVIEFDDGTFYRL